MNNVAIMESAKAHYNLVSDPWRYIFGDDFHFGYFESNDMELHSATKLLIDKLAAMSNIKESSKVLDVGCGIGEGAFYLNEKYKCNIVGITISERGVELASAINNSKKNNPNIEFILADVLNSGFPDNSFDIVWIMEASHLMKDKKKLFLESYRLLKTNGTMLLCDLFLNRNHNPIEVIKYYSKELFRYVKELNILNNTFGKANLETLDYHLAILKNNQFYNIEAQDVSKNVFPTMEHWRKNIKENMEKIKLHLNTKQIDEFLLSCNVLERFFSDNILSYRLLKATKKTYERIT